MDSRSDRRVEFFRGLAGLSAIRGAWQGILEGIERPHFFHLPEYYEAAGTILAREGRGDDMVFGVVREDDRVRAVFPFVATTARRFGFRFRILTSPQPWHLAGDIICPEEKESPEILSFLFRAMAASADIDWDVIHLPAVLDDACASPVLGGATGGLPSELRHVGECCYVPLAPYEEIQARFSAKYRRELRRRARMLDRDGKVEYVKADSVPQLEESFDEFLRLEAAGWKGRKNTAVENKAGNVGEFYREFIRRFAAMGRCEIVSLRVDGKTIAVQLVATTGGTCYLMKIAHDEEYRRYSPGHQVVHRVLRDHAGREGMHTVNLCSDAPWLRDLQPLSRSVYSARIFRERPKALAAHAFYRGKAVVRRLARGGKESS
ncbi:MAG: GNAT family N-acetyltransferase [Lentisphaerae bacterium]|nr:GNAT family N-acetyltransferase [Lentisphaerota bacterium]